MNLKAALIQLPRPSSTCFRCRSDFSEGTEYCSVIQGDDLTPVNPKSAALQRSDFCLTCWQTLRSDNSPQALGANWKSRVTISKEPKPKAHKRIEIALELLKSAHHEGKEPMSDAELFFLALFLARQRQLLFKQEIEKDGEPYQLFEVTNTEEILAVKKIDLRKADLNELQSSLAKRLHGGH